MYLNIAICDDDENDRKLLKSLIDTYMHCNNMTGNITLFSSGEDFLSADSDKPYDIVFMDIYMTGISGVDTILKSPSRNTFQLVFISFSQEHAIEAFNLDAAHYLIKPITEDIVRTAMERCLSRMGNDSPKLIDVRTNKGTIPIPMDHIIYIEVYNKTCVIHTEKNEYKTNKSLDALYGLLGSDIFMRVQRSFVINMSFIESFSYGHITLRNGMEMVPSRSNWDELKKQYSQFLFQLARKGEKL